MPETAREFVFGLGQHGRDLAQGLVGEDAVGRQLLFAGLARAPGAEGVEEVSSMGRWRRRREAEAEDEERRF